MICTKCGKKVYYDGWSNYVSEDDFSEEWGSAVCWVEDVNILHEHEATKEDDKVWASICSAHSNRNYDCSLCKTGHWMSPTELKKDQQLFNNDYPEWYKQHNNGIELNESALEIWHSITRKE